MAETQREHVPLNDAHELDTAVAFLTFARHCLIKKTSETARHAGHADILREQIDGATGR